MSEVFVVGISWRTAPVAVREKLAFREDEVGRVLQALKAHAPVTEALLVSTCNRVEIYGVAHNPAQRWFYVSEVQPDEALLLKCWDSDTSVAQFTPHTAFQDPTTPPGTPPRESIEFRTIAFFD